MVWRNPLSPRIQLSSPSPDSSPCPSMVFTDYDGDPEDTMSIDERMPSRPTSIAPSFEAVGPFCPRVPTLKEILANQAAPPWTLSAFTAYLSQNLCLENLEFTKDAQRYQKLYDELALTMAGIPLVPGMEECRQLKRLWQSLLDNYVKPGAPKEVNLTSKVRDALLSRPYKDILPPPETLDVALRKIYDLMDESIMLSFISDLTPSHQPELIISEPPNTQVDDRSHLRFVVDDLTRTRSRSRRKTSPPRPTDITSHGFGQNLLLRGASTNRPSQSKSRINAHSSNSSNGSNELSDDSSKEPMTPPTTPPGSDMASNPSPKNKSGDNPTWRKVMGRFGPKRKQ